MIWPWLKTYVTEPNSSLELNLRSERGLSPDLRSETLCGQRLQGSLDKKLIHTSFVKRTSLGKLQNKQNPFQKWSENWFKWRSGGGLVASGGRLGSILEPRWRPRAPRGASRAPRGASRGALMANLALRWANLARKWGPKSIGNRQKLDATIL